jgi:recombination protein RecA
MSKNAVAPKAGENGKTGEAPEIVRLQEAIHKVAGEKLALINKRMKEAKMSASMLLLTGEAQKIPRLPSGSLDVDFVLGGGWPIGRIHEIMGWESSGKTTIALHAVAEAQKLGKTAAFIDAEHALSPEYAQKLGVDLDALLFYQPDSGEQALSVVEMCVEEGVDLIIVDSVAALVPQAEIDGEMGDSHMGLQARLMSQAMRKLNPRVKRNNVTLILLNQMRQKIGVMFGNNETTPGGNALKFNASIRMECRALSAKTKDGTDAAGQDNVTGNKISIKTIKNKTAPPFRRRELQIVYGKGVDLMSELLSFAERLKVVSRGGSWYSYGSQKNIANGRDSMLALLESDPDLTQMIRDEVDAILAGVGDTEE